MSFKKKPISAINLEQHELLEQAQRRINQKKGLFSHFVIFFVASVFLLVLNKIMKYGAMYDWAVWAILLWTFLLILHTVNVFVRQKFMGQDWERRQREQLVGLQKARIAKMQQEVETDFPLSDTDEKEAL